MTLKVGIIHSFPA